MPRCCKCLLSKPCSGLQILAGKDLLWQGTLPQSLKAFTQDELEQALLQGSTARDGEAAGTGELCPDVPDSCWVARNSHRADIRFCCMGDDEHI